MRDRYDDPVVGRFTSRDLWPVDIQNPVELNRYGYTANYPVTWSDPSSYFAIASNAATYRNTAATSGALFLLGRQVAIQFSRVAFAQLRGLAGQAALDWFLEQLDVLGLDSEDLAARVLRFDDVRTRVEDRAYA
jgi:hypothetical protein